MQDLYPYPKTSDLRRRFDLHTEQWWGGAELGSVEVATEQDSVKADAGVDSEEAAAGLDLMEAAHDHVLVVKGTEADSVGVGGSVTVKDSVAVRDSVAVGDSVAVTDLVVGEAEPGSEEDEGLLGELGGIFLLGLKAGAQQC
ncbi:hypothetical protein PR001_g6276 [Phytophthora rubi]|uniref:Uncharacterized protein n=1 Tax=Phytophthora rubi TaxID=129364 RepID=A0A6A3NJ45_9STRA|nr:hypothetical protein PR001_g6276 [Phytophthora rubi]